MVNAGDLVRASDFLDTGWIDRDAELASGYSSLDSLASRRIGNVVYWRGRIRADTNWGSAFSANNVFDDVGSMWTPDINCHQLQASGQTVDEFFRVLLRTDGAMQVRNSGTNSTEDLYLYMSYVVDNPSTI